MVDDQDLFVPLVAGNAMATAQQTTLINAKVRLCKSVVPEDDNTVRADLVAIEADYTGYAAKVVAAFSGPFNDADGKAALISPLQNFNPSGSTVTNSIYGGWVEDSTGVLLYVFRLANPVPMLSALSNLALVIEPRIPGPGVVHQLV